MRTEWRDRSHPHHASSSAPSKIVTWCYRHKHVRDQTKACGEIIATSFKIIGWASCPLMKEVKEVR